MILSAKVTIEPNHSSDLGKKTHIIPRFPNLCVNFSGIKMEIMIFYISSMNMWDWILYFPYL